MEQRVFLRSLETAVRPLLPAALRAYRSSSAGFGLTKLWYGNPAIHYECSLRHRIRTIELGLHFEADPLTNARLLGAFAAHRGQIRRALGDGVKVEEWDRGWSRVWESWPWEGLDDGLRDRLARRLADYVRALEPLLRDELPADVPWRPPAETAASVSRAARRAPTPKARPTR